TYFSCQSGVKGDNDWFEVIEFLSKGNFQNIIDHLKVMVDSVDRDKRIKSALNYLWQLCNMMNDFTSAGVFFPDLKPSNLMLKNHQFIVSDLKSLILFDKSKRLATTAVKATRIYLPPEQAKKNADKKINVDFYHSYQTGLTIYLFAMGLTGEDGPYKI